jgi:protein involved in polysaccharide export with SLBB domain
MIWIACLAGTALFICGCGSPPPPAPSPTTSTTPADDRGKTTPLQINDTIRVILTGTPTTIEPMEKVIGDNGTISLPNIDQPILAVGKSPEELQTIIHDLLVPGIYLRVNVTVLPEDRYFYISGQVNASTTGRQLYLSRITLTRAIATANGFNQFAARHRVQVTRLDGTVLIVDYDKALKDPKLDVEILPGDRIYVDKRTFIEAATGK